VSGDRTLPPDVIVLAGGAGSVTSRLVQVVAKLTSVPMGPYAVIGGLAVSCRLAQAHRATGDVDTLVETTSPTALQRITAAVGHRDPDSGTLTVDGVTVDVIDTEAITSDDLDGIDGPDRLFVAGHRYALESATVATVVAGTATDAPSASFPLATPAGLIGTKVHALQTRPDRNSPKRSTDLYDIYRLTAAHHDAIVVALRDAPFDLGQLVIGALHETVLDDPTRAVRPLRLADDVALNTLTADDLVDVLGHLADDLASGTRGATVHASDLTPD
jgi:hypothetical protein